MIKNFLTRLKILLVLLCVNHLNAISQSALPDSVYNKKRVNIVIAGNAVVYGGTMVALYSAWYSNYKKSSFHSFNDIGEWNQMDKFGHIYSAYTESRLSIGVWKWAGLSRKKSIWLGGLSGPVYQTVIEILDGFSAEWGWSWADFSANIIGGAAVISQELLWNEQKFQLKTSFHKKIYADKDLNKQSDELFGTSIAERFLKDYNGQTYWVSTGIKTIFPSSNIPDWLQISAGTGIEGHFGAFKNDIRPDIKRYRQWYIAPDIDLTKIKTNKKGIKTALNILNSLKFPAPAIEFSNGSFHWKWLAF